MFRLVTTFRSEVHFWHDGCLMEASSLAVVSPSVTCRGKAEEPSFLVVIAGSSDVLVEE